MKNFTRIVLMCALLCFGLKETKAQYVTIPDTNFRNWLNANGYASCMNGNQMDTTCNAVVYANYVNCVNDNIFDLTGISYFDRLTDLICYANHLTSLPALPNTLKALYCYSNQLTSLPSLPNSLTQLYTSSNQLTSLPPLPNLLTNLNCGYNQLTSLPTLPNSLKTFDCGSNHLTSLLTLPPSLTELDCYGNQLSSLPLFPNSLINISCYNNQLTSLPFLPNSLKNLNCGGNNLTSLPSLPNSLGGLYCSYNQLTSLPSLPNTLKGLSCSSNQLSLLPSLPDSLTNLNCLDNQLTSLPILPSSLSQLLCGNNQLTSLPVLPASLNTLWCFYNQLSWLPAFPSSLRTLNCNHNQLTSLPALLTSLDGIDCSFNNLSSLPALKDTIYYLVINDNTGLMCLPAIHKIINNFTWNNTGITCFPNTLSAGTATPSIVGVPICSIPSVPTSITVSGVSAKVCPGDTRTYTTPLVSGVTYNWTVPTGAVINSGQGTRTINVTYNSGFTSNGIISVKKVQGCGVSAAKTLAVNRNVAATPSTITGLTYGLCGATNKTYSVTQVAGMTYQWTLPAGASFVNGQGTNSVTVNFPSTNFTGTVSVKVVNGCGAGNARNLTVRAVPATPVSVTGAATACANQAGVGYSTAAVATATSYNWTVPTGGVITSGQGSNAIVMKFGTSGGNVRVRAVNGCGAGAYRSKAVVINCREGFSDMDDAFEVVAYPNPSKDVFTVRVLTPTLKGALWENNYSLVVRDVIGRVVYEKEKISKDGGFEFGQEFLSGVYFAEVKQGDQRKIVRLIKNN